MVFKVQKVGGDERNRTADPLLARQVLSQLSYAPTFLLLSAKTCLVGLSGLEPLTSRLSGVRSNQLSYRPAYSENGSLKTKQYVELTDVRPHLMAFLPECVSLERR